MNEVSVSLLCVQVRSGAELWIEKSRAENFMKWLAQPNAPQFVECEGNMINRADIVGIFTPQVMETSVRRKNGEWQCKKGQWHERKQECGCRSLEETRGDEEFFKINGYYPA